jgi:peroxiredoxin
MAQISLNTPAPDFEMADFNGNLVRLSDQIGKSNVLLVFNRGFT